MARLRTLAPAQGASRVHPTTVDCSWQLVADGDRRLLQLSTYGSDDRVSQPKVSQTIQIDRVVAQQLYTLLRETFDL